MLKKECFKIRLLETENSNIFEWKDWRVIKEILCSRSELEMNPTMIVADPFLFVHDEILYLFYEHKDLETPGVLKMTSTENLEEWSEPVTVLKEPCHLSYPWVFKHENHIYMIPETGAGHAIRLYEGNSDLTQFHFKKTLLSRDEYKDDTITTDFADSSVFEKDGLFYLMTSVKRNMINELQLYISKQLEGPYHLHPQSPICVGNKYGRNAGCLIEKSDKIFRVAQDCVKNYGDQIHLLQIDEFSDSKYKEHIVKENILPHNNFYKCGGHQFCCVTFRNKQIIATDAKEYRFYFLARIAKFVKSKL